MGVPASRQTKNMFGTVPDPPENPIPRAETLVEAVNPQDSAWLNWLIAFVILAVGIFIAVTAKRAIARLFRRSQADSAHVEILAARVIHFMRALAMPNGLSLVGYTDADIPALVEGTLPQHRVTKLSPIPAEAPELTRLFEQSLTIW